MKNKSFIYKISTFLLFTFLFFYSCENKNLKQSSLVNFTVASKTSNVIVAYTNDNKSLWTNSEWVNEVKMIMKDLSKNYDTVLLFDSKEHTPNVAIEGMNFSLDFDQWMVCGYWKYPNGTEQFCYGGERGDGNFKYCDEE